MVRCWIKQAAMRRDGWFFGRSLLPVGCWTLTWWLLSPFVSIPLMNTNHQHDTLIEEFIDGYGNREQSGGHPKWRTYHSWWSNAWPDSSWSLLLCVPLEPFDILAMCEYSLKFLNMGWCQYVAYENHGILEVVIFLSVIQLRYSSTAKFEFPVQ